MNHVFTPTSRQGAEHRPLDSISRKEVEERFNRITTEHGWGAANQTLAMLRSIDRRPCVDHEGLRNPVELWLVGGGRFTRQRRRVTEGYAADWTVEQLREPAQRIADRIDELSLPPPMDTAVSS